MATANVQISNWTSVEKKSFPSLERILWIWNTVSQGKTNLSGIGSLKPSFVASQSPFLCLFYVFFFFFFLLSCCVWKKPYVKVKEIIHVIYMSAGHFEQNQRSFQTYSTWSVVLKVQLPTPISLQRVVLKMSPVAQFSSQRYRYVGCFLALQWFSYLNPNVFSETTKSPQTIDFLQVLRFHA